MTSQPPGIPWSAAEAAGINEFLSTQLGRKWLGVLLTRKPRMDLSSTDKAALTGAYAAGYESFFAEIATTRVVMQSENMSAKSIDPTKD